MNNEQLLEQKYKSFWYAEWTFPIFVAFLSAGIFAGTHMFYVYHVGAFNDIAIVAMLSAGIEGGSYGAAAAFGASFLFARVLEGSLIGILDIGGAIQTGLGIGVPALMLGAGNASGRYLGPLIVISAATASIPVGLGAIAGAGAFYAWKKPIAGGAIIGAMIMGAFFPLPLN
ncbi:DUF4310 family protein [Paenibacillus larvae]